MGLQFIDVVGTIFLGLGVFSLVLSLIFVAESFLSKKKKDEAIKEVRNSTRFFYVGVILILFAACIRFEVWILPI